MKMDDEYNTIYKTAHGNYIARQIQNEDAYGYFNVMNESDLYNIVDQFQTHIMDYLPDRDDLISMMGRWLEELENNYDIELF
jgi:hypothetical protein